jgi:8-oxo-dGTP pyrophosphatase MutT (NUDIX family)
MSKQPTIQSHHYYHYHGVLQASVAMLSYTDENGEPHILMGRNDPRWPGKITSNQLHFIGGKVDMDDIAHTHTASLPTRLRLPLSGSQMAQNTNRSVKKRSDHRANPQALVHKAAHYETLLEGSLRELQEETGLFVLPQLEASPDSFIAHKLCEPEPAHGTKAPMESHYFHIHLGKLSKEAVKNLNETLHPRDDLLMAGFVPAQHIETTRKGATIVRDFPKLAKRRDEWQASPESLATLETHELHETDVIERHCDINPHAYLKETGYNDKIQKVYGAHTAYDNGWLARHIVQGLQAIEQGKPVEDAFAQSQPPPSPIVRDITHYAANKPFSVHM